MMLFIDKLLFSLVVVTILFKKHIHTSTTHQITFFPFCCLQHIYNTWKMESMVNLEKEFQNLYVQKKKNGHIKSIIKYFNTAHKKIFTSRHYRQDRISEMDEYNSSVVNGNPNSVTPFSNNDYFYNHWAMRMCI